MTAESSEPIHRRILNRLLAQPGEQQDDGEDPDDGEEREIMWRSVGLLPCEDGSTYVVQQMVAVSDTVEAPYDSHRTIHIDAARNPADFNPEEIPKEWQEPQERWEQ